MTKDEAREILEQGGRLKYHAWIWSKDYVACWSGCCNDSLEGVEDALDNIESMLDGDWEEVKVSL